MFRELKMAAETISNSMATLCTYIRNKNKSLLGYLVIIFSVITVTIGRTSLQILGVDSMPKNQMLGLRLGLQVLLLVPLQIREGCILVVAREKIKWLALSSVLFMLTNFLYLYAVLYLPLGNFKATDICVQLVLLVSMDLCCNRKWRCYMIVAVLICISGSILIVQPEIIPPVFYQQTERSNSTRAILSNVSISETQYIDSNDQIEVQDIPLQKLTDENIDITIIESNVTSSINLTITEELIPLDNSTNAFNAVLSDEAFGYLTTALGSTTMSGYLFVLKTKLDDLPVSTVNFYGTASGSVLCLLVSGLTETFVWPTDGRSIGLFLAFALGYGKSQSDAIEVTQ